MTEQPYTDRLRAKAAELREAAEALLTRTGLIDLLAERVGPPVVVGSVALDLMSWPDIDIHIPLAYPNRWRMPDMIPDLYRRLETAGLAVHRVQLLDDYIDPHPLGAGLYCGVQLVERTSAVRAWKCDIWGWEPDDFVRRQMNWDTLVANLAGADRDLILRLKDEARAKPGLYGERVTSMDLYLFAIARAGTALGELEAFAEKRRG